MHVEGAPSFRAVKRDHGMQPDHRVPRVVAIDWSGANALSVQRRHIWLAEALHGTLVRLSAGRTREEVVEELVTLARDPDPVVAGLDFAFSLPAWFAQAHGCESGEDVWHLVQAEGERWLRECPPPFWGRPGRKRLERADGPELRQTEEGTGAKSVLQIGGAGAVGTGSLRGMPFLLRLRGAGFHIWPFDPWGPATVVEIYPRVLTGPVTKSSDVDRAAYLDTRDWVIPPEVRGCMVASEDAFDAGVSALVMAEHVHEPGDDLPASAGLEGAIWHPAAPAAEHVRLNRAHWDAGADEYREPGRRRWADVEPRWGIWGIPERDVGLLPDVDGLDVVELGCGTGYVSAWLARRGALTVAIDNSSAQLATARELQAEFGLSFPLLWADAEALPFADESFDLAVTEYGANIWCDPDRWVPEAARVLRPGGRLIFLGNAPLLMLCVPDEDGVPAGPAFLRDHFGMHRFEWPDERSVEFHLGHGDLIRLLRRCGLEVEDLIELRPPEGATTRYDFVTLEWARRWPAEEAWVTLKRRG